MTTAYLLVTILTILANAGIAVADLAGAAFVLDNSAEVRVPRSWLPRLAALKIAGASGLVLGLLGFHVLGVAAAVGLSLFFVGAIVAHLRARVVRNIGFPGAYLALAIATLALSIMH